MPEGPTGGALGMGRGFGDLEAERARQVSSSKQVRFSGAVSVRVALGQDERWKQLETAQGAPFGDLGGARRGGASGS